MLILASSSPTRAKILKKFNVNFVQKPLDINEEEISISNPKSFVYEVAKLKYQKALEMFKDSPFLCADTIVQSNNQILKKAKSKEEAKKLLSLQSGKTISIITCMFFYSQKIHLIDISQTVYEFKIFDTTDMQNFLDSNQWQGKAGACMVEGFCKKYIKSVKGYESCAMGLTIEKLLPFL